MPELGPDADEPGRRHSSFRLEVTLSVGYQRRRAQVEGAWEGRVVTVGLLAAGVIVVLYVVYEVLHRVFG